MGVLLRQGLKAILSECIIFGGDIGLDDQYNARLDVISVILLCHQGFHMIHVERRIVAFPILETPMLSRPYCMLPVIAHP